MFGNGVDAISNRLDNINLNYTTMQPKAERPPVCPKTKLPLLHLTPSEKKVDGSPHQGVNDPWLLKPNHDIPSTPPPQVESIQMYPERTG
ncbi:uncharacterized protein LOC134755430 [Cydia strobilella]|uniref:uncharacterized protein LOC134755430 n=1 Tax=Cydia strobilella TaxID=1100964 RepID=UPI0030077C97